MTSIRLVLLFVPALVLGARSNLFALPETGSPQSVTDALRILTDSDDSDQLTQAALTICASANAEDVGRLLHFLKDAKFLDRFDSRKDYDFKIPRLLGIWKVVLALAKHPDQGEGTLLALMSNDVFMSHAGRRKVLIAGVEQIRNPSARFLDALENQAVAKKVPVIDLIGGLAKMRSTDAASRIERWWKSLRQPVFKATALHCFLEVRNEPGIVSLYCGLLKSDVDESWLRNLIVQTLFDYRPRDWFGGPALEHPHLLPKVPPRYEAKTEVLEELLKMAEVTADLELSEETRKGVKKARQEIDRLLEFRRAGGPEKVAKLIEDLSANTHAVREGATRALEKYGDLAEAGLRAALRTKLPLESRTRAERILSKVPRAPSPWEEEMDRVWAEFVVRELKADPKLSVAMSLIAEDQDIVGVFAVLEKDTGYRFRLADHIANHWPRLGSLQLKEVPAWTVMKLLAERELVAGHWEKDDKGYVLTAKESLAPKAREEKKALDDKKAQAAKAWADFARLHPLGLDARLRVKLPLVAVSPRLNDVLSQLEEATGLKLTRDEALADHEPDLGDLQLPNVHAYSVMELIARSHLSNGRWEPTPEGYRLTGVSQVPRPASFALWAWTGVVFLIVIGVAGASYFVICVLALFSRGRALQSRVGEPSPGAVDKP